LISQRRLGKSSLVVVFQNVRQGINGKVFVQAHIQVFPERQALHLIRHGATAQIGSGVQDFEQRRAGKDNF
jgi:hypothetical protein